LIAHAERYGGRTAILDAQGSFTYDKLLDSSLQVATALLVGRNHLQHTDLQDNDLHEERIAFLITPGFPWVAVQWGIWRAGGVAVPLPISSTRPELEYFIDDAQASTLVFDAHAASLLAPIAAARGIRALSYEQLLGPAKRRSCRHVPSDIPSDRRAMILYTSGTTSRPKGVVTTHANIVAQIETLVEAWEWSPTIAFCCVCRCTTCTESSTLFPVRCGRVRPAKCCRASTPTAVWDSIASGNDNSVHGGADGLRKAHRRLGRGFAGAPRRVKPTRAPGCA
jgi:malonyl-CoA/methylmalonyl-CoA synthetase